MSLPERIPWGPWYEDPTNLADLWDWMTYRCMEPDDPSDYMREPWKYSPEWKEMIDSEDRAA